MIAIDMEMPENCVECRFSEVCPYYNEDRKGNACYQKMEIDALNLLKDYNDALKTMVYQYCTIKKKYLFKENCQDPDKEIFFNSHMSAGEEAFKVLGIENFQEVPEDWLEW